MGTLIVLLGCTLILCFFGWLVLARLFEKIGRFVRTKVLKPFTEEEELIEKRIEEEEK